MRHFYQDPNRVQRQYQGLHCLIGDMLETCNRKKKLARTDLLEKLMTLTDAGALELQSPLPIESIIVFKDQGGVCISGDLPSLHIDMVKPGEMLRSRAAYRSAETIQRSTLHIQGLPIVHSH